MTETHREYHYPSDAEWYPWLPEFLRAAGAAWWRERPLRVTWEITNMCNLQCRQCATLAWEHDETHPKIPSNELSTAEGQSLIDVWTDMSIPILCFSGGEPLLREDFFDLANHAMGRFRSVCVETNGTLLNDTVAREMVKVGIDEVSIGIDGATPETHNAIRNRDSYYRAIAGIKAAQQAGLRVTVVTTPLKMNAEEIGDVLQALFRVGVSTEKIRHQLTTYVPIGRALTESFEPTPAEQATLFEAWCDAGRVVWAGTAVPLWVPRDDVEARCTAVLHGCTAGKHVVVNSEGDIYPCAYLGRVSVDYIIGNVREDDFGSLWRNHATLTAVQDFRSNLAGECGECLAKEACGGCRARAVLVTKELGAADPWAATGICSVLRSNAPPLWARC